MVLNRQCPFQCTILLYFFTNYYLPCSDSHIPASVLDLSFVIFAILILKFRLLELFSDFKVLSFKFNFVLDSSIK